MESASRGLFQGEPKLNVAVRAEGVLQVLGDALLKPTGDVLLLAGVGLGCLAEIEAKGMGGAELRKGFMKKLDVLLNQDATPRL